MGALPRMRALKVIQTLEAGVDWIAPHVPQGVTLCDARGVHDGPVAEWVLAATLAMQKRLGLARDNQRQRSWRAEPIDDLHGQTVLIVGYGSIGEAVERRLAPFGVEVLRLARHRRRGVHAGADLPQLLPDADIVVLVLPLTAETERLVDARFLRTMRDGALLVNAARGRIVETEALVTELRSGRLRAALDVADPEPLPPHHPLWDAGDVLITPHLASDTPSFPPRAYRLAFEQVERQLTGGQLVNVVRDGY